MCPRIIQLVVEVGVGVIMARPTGCRLGVIRFGVGEVEVVGPVEVVVSRCGEEVVEVPLEVAREARRCMGAREELVARGAGIMGLMARRRGVAVVVRRRRPRGVELRAGVW